MHLGRSSIGALLGALLFSVNARAQLDVVQPQCTPDWWAVDHVSSALDVELGPRAIRIAFVVDEPCDTGTIVSVLVEAEDGRRRRSIDLGDLPAQARPRAIAMGVAAMLRAPPEASSQPDGLPGGEPSAGEDETAEEASTEAPAETTSPADADTTERVATPEGSELEGTLAEPLPAPRAPEPARTQDRGNTPQRDGPSRRPWNLTLTGVGLWTSSRTPWFGAGGSLEYVRESGWSLRVGVDGARTETSDALGAVRGRLVATHLSAGWRHAWDSLHLGARATVLAERIDLAGRSTDDGVQTEGRSRWSGSAELTLLVEAPLGRRVAITADVGVRLTPWGLSASSPSGTVLAVSNASGLARLGVSVWLP